MSLVGCIYTLEMSSNILGLPLYYFYYILTTNAFAFEVVQYIIFLRVFFLLRDICLRSLRWWPAFLLKAYLFLWRLYLQSIDFCVRVTWEVRFVRIVRQGFSFLLCLWLRSFGRRILRCPLRCLPWYNLLLRAFEKL